VLTVAVLLVASAALAGETVLRGDGSMKLAITGGERVRTPDGSTVVQGKLLLSPRADALPGSWTAFVVDGETRYSTNNPQPTLALDTTELSEGTHTVRIDNLDGTRRVASTGDIALQVANQAVISQVGQAAPGQPAFVKLHHKKILREIVWFNGREGDLEKHGTIRGNRCYLTLTDLMRHIGGTIDWGPPRDLLLATRGGVTVRVIPGSKTVYVNGQAQQLPVATFRKGNLTWVPIRPMCEFYGIQVDWDYDTDRAYITYQIDEG
jgi:hypothetical protein